MPAIPNDDSDLLFYKARTHYHWLDKPVSDELLKSVYDMAKMAPTSANCQPMRVCFVKSAEAKAKLKPCLDAGNVEKTLGAPVTAIIAHDARFYDYLPKLFPHADARAWFAGEGKEEYAKVSAFRNGTLQGAYFILAARAHGLDCGPMSGFNNDKVDVEFFKDNTWKSNFLVNLGYGDAQKLFPRAPRPEFAEFCRIL